MADPIATAFVRIRPTSVGFQQEATQQIATSVAGVQRSVTGAGRAAGAAAGEFDHFERGLVLTEARALGLRSVLGSVSTAFIGGVGLASVIHTATEEFSRNSEIAAATQAILTATGATANVTARQIQSLATAIEHKTGIDDEQVKSAENVLLTFRAVRNEVGRGNDVFTRATRSATDLSRVFGTDVASTARQLGRALQDPTRGLQTLRRAGLTFTTAQTAQIKALAETGQVLKAQTLILDEVDRRVRGTAEAIGRTLPGQLSILRERAKDALGEYVKRLSESRDAQSAVATGAAAVASGFRVVERAVATVGPPLIAVAKAAKSVEGAIGAGPILAAVIGYKSLAIAVGLASRTKALYARAAAVATASNLAEAASTTAVTAATRVEVGSLTGATLALRGVSTAAAGAAAANTEVAASEVAVGLAARASALGVGAGRLALSAVGGPLGAVALGLGAAAAGFILLRRHAANAAGTINATRRSLTQLNDALNARRELRVQVSGFEDAVRQSKAFAQAAAASLASAERRQTGSAAPAGSLQARALAEQVRVARAALARATADVATAEDRLATAQANRFQQQQRQPAVIDATTRALLAQIDAVRQQSRVDTAGQFRIGGFTQHQPAAERARTTLARFLALTDKLSASGTRAEKIVGGALGRIASTLDRLPTEKQIRVVVSVATAGGTIADAVRQAGLLRSNEDIAAAGADARSRSAQAIGQENVALEQQFLAAERVLRTEQKTLATKKAAAAQAISVAQSARDAVRSATDSLTNANEALASSQQALADAIKSGQDAVTNAVNSAKTNLRSIADQIAQAIGQAADQGALKVGPEGPLARRFQALRDQILAGRGGPDTQRAAQEVAARLQAQQQPTDDVAGRAKRRLDDLADSFNRGRIGATQFNAGVQRILRDFGLNLRTFGRTFGSAALHDLRDQLRAARQQAQAVAAGPTRPGGGQAPNIVRPLQAVAQAQRDTRDAEKNVERATRDVGRATRDLNQKQLVEARTHTKELRAIREAVQAQLRVAKQQDKLTKPKPTGRDGKTAAEIAKAGAGSP